MIDFVDESITGSFSITMEQADEGRQALLDTFKASMPTFDIKIVTDRWFMPQIIIRDACYTWHDGAPSPLTMISWGAGSIEYIHRNLFTRFVYFLWRIWHRFVRWWK